MKRLSFCICSSTMSEGCRKNISSEIYLFLLNFICLVLLLLFFVKCFIVLQQPLCFQLGTDRGFVSSLGLMFVLLNKNGGSSKKKKKRNVCICYVFQVFHEFGHFDISDLLQSKIPKKISHMRMSQWWQRVLEVLKTRRHSRLTLWGTATWSNFYGKQFWTIWNPEICISCIVSLG